MSKRDAGRGPCLDLPFYATCVLLAWASAGGEAAASCQMPGTQAGPAVLAEYIDKPRSLMLGFPQGGYGLQSMAGQLAASGTKGLDALMLAASSGSEAQRQAVGRGLGDAANRCQMQDGAIALRVTNTAMSSGNTVVKRSFVAVVDPGTTAAPSFSTLAGTPPPPLPDDLTLPKIASGKTPLADPFGSFEQWH